MGPTEIPVRLNGDNLQITFWDLSGNTARTVSGNGYTSTINMAVEFYPIK
jgi:hypothetical protein